MKLATLLLTVVLLACSKRSSTESPPAASASTPSPARTDRWVVAKGQFDGRPLLMRVRTELGAWVGHPGYPTKVTIAYAYGDGGVDGLPSQSALAALETFEHRLFRAVDKNGIAIVVAVATTGGHREFIAYADEGALKRSFNAEFGGDEHRHPVELSAVNDAAWQEYRGILRNAGMKE